MPAVITIPTPQWQQQQQQQEQEQQKKKKEEEEDQKPKKQYQSLHYDEALLLLRFISSNDSISFMSYCDTHMDVLGGKGTDKRQKMKNHIQYWRKEGKLPSKYNDPSYPEELVRFVSFKLSMMAKQKAENRTNNNNKTNNNSSNNSSNRKGNETPRNETSDKNSNSKEENKKPRFSSPTITSLSSSSMKKLPTSPNDKVCGKPSNVGGNFVVSL